MLWHLHAAWHLHLGKPSRNLEETGWLRAFLNVAKFSAAVLRLPFQREAQLGIDPEVIDASVCIGGFKFHRAAAVYRIIADFMAGRALIFWHLLPIVASGVYISRLKKKISLTLHLCIGWHLHIHVLLVHHNHRGLSREIDDESSAAMGAVISRRLDSHFVFGEIHLGARLGAGLLQIDDLGGEVRLRNRNCRRENDGGKAKNAGNPVHHRSLHWSVMKIRKRRVQDAGLALWGRAVEA